MLGTHDLPLFILAGLLLNITPGADTLYIVARSTTQGSRSGAIAALGIGAGCFVHIFGAALGLSALLAASAAAFTVLKLIGAAYLVYLGVSMFVQGGRLAPRCAAPNGVPLRQVFTQGVLTNVMNPKVALFFLAFLPQFIEPHAPNKIFAFLCLGLVFNVNGTLWNLFVAWSADHISRRLHAGRRGMTWFHRVMGATLVGLGVSLAFHQRGAG